MSAPRFQGSSFWCNGCGNHQALHCIESALAALAVEPDRVVVVSGVGCAGKTSGFLDCYAVQAPHGRAIPIAAGIALANPTLTVIVATGDADIYAIGLSHLVHAAKRDVNITCVVLNNETMALTEGQQLPESGGGFDPLTLALAGGAGFVARGTVNNQTQAQSLVIQAISHNGFSIVDLQSPCVVYGHPIPDSDAVAPCADVADAFQVLASRRATGLIYQRAVSPLLKPRIPVKSHRPPSDFDDLLNHLNSTHHADSTAPHIQDLALACDSPLCAK
jgi:pyruvate/2-oxoacid:ferredoxin oxidoreductase beta subunit